MEQGKTERLNALQGAAWRATLYLALLLLLVICFFLFMGIRPGIALTVIVAGLYWLVLHPSKARYRDAVQEALLLSSVKSLNCTRYIRQVTVTPEEVRTSGVLPMDKSGILLRYNLEAATENLVLHLCDLSCVYSFMSDRRQAVTFSGCWATVKSHYDCGFTCLFCPSNLLPSGILNDYYEKQGLHPRTLAVPGWLCFESSERPIPAESLDQFTHRLMHMEDAVFRFNENGCDSLIFHHFLNQGEPDLKTPWTQARLSENVLPWLFSWLDTVQIAYDYNSKKHTKESED